MTDYDRTDYNNLKVHPCPPGYFQCSHLTSFGNDQCVILLTQQTVWLQQRTYDLAICTSTMYSLCRVNGRSMQWFWQSMHRKAIFMVLEILVPQKQSSYKNIVVLIIASLGEKLWNQRWQLRWLQWCLIMLLLLKHNGK